jgi:rhomboid protease GluP
LIWIRPRLRILTYKHDSGNDRFFFQFLFAGTIAVSSIVSQHYLTTATGQLEILLNIKQIEKVEKVRYYEIIDFDVAHNLGGSFVNLTTSGRRGRYFNIHVYFVFPILSDASEEISHTPKYWYGIKFEERMSNRISKEAKEVAWRSFYDECAERVDNYDFHDLDHFERIPTRNYYLKAIETRVKKTDKSFVILEPVKESYEDRNGHKLAWIFGSFGIGCIVILFSLIWPGYYEFGTKKDLSRKKTNEDN